ncbi:MAG: hypothetical protein M5U22_21275 [Thermoleophilia bacterium]|nr:hypothetical protein [Thermoleophilia bacterium]
MTPTKTGTGKTPPPETIDNVFPRHSGKTYALAEVMPGETPMVGKGPEGTVFSYPVVLLWEVVLFLGVTLSVFLFSLFKSAPLEEIANPLVTTDPAKAPWYFLGLQEMLEHMHPLAAGVLLPGAFIAFLVAVPYVDGACAGAGRWFGSTRPLRSARRHVGWIALYGLVVMPAYIALDNAFTLRELLRGSAPQWIAQGLAPGGILVVLVLLPAVVVRLRRAPAREVVMALFTVMFVAAVVFTVSGFLFRGPGFELHWPWRMPDGYNPWDAL